MNKSEWAALLALAAYVVASATSFIATGTYPDFTIGLPLVIAIYSAFHASGSAVATVNAAPATPPAK